MACLVRPVFGVYTWLGWTLWYNLRRVERAVEKILS
jgi:hypothetical protein